MTSAHLLFLLSLFSALLLRVNPKFHFRCFGKPEYRQYTPAVSRGHREILFILPTNASLFYFNAKAMMPAADMALEDIVERQILPGFNISCSFVDSTCQSLGLGIQLRCLQYVEQFPQVNGSAVPHVIFGPFCTYAAMEIVKVQQSGYLKIPMVTVGALSTGFSKRVSFEF